MRVKFLGGAGEVGRAAVLVKTAAGSVLFDYGVNFDQQGRPVFPEHVRPKDLVAVVLSHAHLDHSGALPSLYVSVKTPIYATPLTMELSDVMYTDMIKLSGYYLPYTHEEVKATMESAIPLTYGEPVELAPDVTLTVYNAGHVPGSAVSVLEAEGRIVVFTGDFNLRDTALLRGADVYNLPREPDVVVMEATYAAADHPPRQDLEKDFVNVVREVVEGGGTVLIPSFALGRAQEVLLTLVKYGVGPIYVDGLARQVNTIVDKYPHLLNDYGLYRKALEAAVEIPSAYVRKKAVGQEPAVIISPAGMLKGGASLYYFKRLAGDGKNAIILPSFQAPDTPGFEVLSKGEAFVDGSAIRVKARVEWFDFSAHSGRSELVEFIEHFGVNSRVVLFHTEPSSALQFARWMQTRGRDNLYVPLSAGEELEL
ncbi:MAG: MBL fold metallo-hydrolase [Thermoproteus sp.]|nr:MBL fold metallo-hydrolase [Thermoproteus sp.]